MPKSLRELLASMMDSRDGVHPSIQTFPPIDAEQLARELRLESRGTDAGQRELPDTASTVLDVAELDIAAEIERRARKATEDYRTQLDLYDARIRRSMVSVDQRIEIEAAGRNVLADFRVRAIDDLNHLQPAQEELAGRQQEMQDFRTQNELRRLPILKTPRERLFRTVVLAIFVVIESILNGMFFAKGSEQGVIGGVTQAFVLSLLNVGVAVLFAIYGASLLRHSRRVVMAIGVIATFAYLGWALGLNLCIAHFRDAFVANAGNVEWHEVWNGLLQSPFLLSDAQSWLLAVMGISLSILSVIDASGFNDGYPGYDAIGRRCDAAVRAYADEKSECLAGLTNLRDAAIGQMQEVLEVMKSFEYELRLALEGRTRLHRDFVAFFDHASDVHVRLRQTYWEANRRARTSPPPERFSSPAARPTFLRVDDLAPAPDLAADARGAVIERMDYFITAINEEFEAAVHRFRTVEGLAGAPHAAA